jgi:hypothetical protein
MVQRIPLKATTNRKRAYEVKSGADTEFAVLPGEEPLPFELLRAKVAEEWAPDGPVEEDLVHTIAKCIWRKQRHQPFAAAKYDPKSKGYQEVWVLNEFRLMLEFGTEEHEITEFHKALGGYFEYHLKTRCPRTKFNSVAEWVEALKSEVDTVLKPVDDRIGASRIVFVKRSAAPDNELFARELEFEERNDAMLYRALDRLEKIRAAKRQITFAEVRRFSKTHPRRLGGSPGPEAKRNKT